MELIFFEDNFNDNSNNWWTGKDNGGWCDIINGSYVIEHIKETNDYSVWKNLPLIESKAYSLEASFTFLNGFMKNGFGFLWGQKSSSNSIDIYEGFHYFIVSASGKFVIRTYNPLSKITEPVKDWTDSSYIKVGDNCTNVLKIMKFDNTIDNQIYFFINNELVFSTTNLPLFGFETGFIVFQKMKIKINGFKATYYTA